MKIPISYFLINQRLRIGLVFIKFLLSKSDGWFCIH